MGLVTLHDIFCASYPEYERTHLLPAHVRRAARAIMQCRTAALGGHIQACPAGHMSRIWYNSCRHRSCPQCAYLQTERWLALQQARLLACEHSHVIFTLPHDLHPLWRANVPVMSTLLFQAARDTLCDLLAAPKYLGAQPGIIAALPTWSQTLVLHPHLHCLVTGGGLSAEGHWVAVRNGFLLPVRVVMAVLRGKMLGALRRAFAQDELVLPGAMRPQQFLNLLNRLGHAQKTPWNVHLRERYRHGAGVATYLARYLRGGPIKNARLVAYDGDRVTFTYRARAEESPSGSTGRPRITLSTEDFLQLVAPACTSPPGTCGALLWAVPSYPCRGLGALPGAGGPAARGRPGRARLADGLCPARRRAPGTVSDLRAAPGMHWGHSAGWGATTRAVGRARRMRSPPQWRPARGVVCRVAASWCRIGACEEVAGLPKCEGPTRRRRILVRGLGQQAGRRRLRLA